MAVQVAAAPVQTAAQELVALQALVVGMLGATVEEVVGVAVVAAPVAAVVARGATAVLQAAAAWEVGI